VRLLVLDSSLLLLLEEAYYTGRGFSGSATGKEDAGPIFFLFAEDLHVLRRTAAAS